MENSGTVAADGPTRSDSFDSNSLDPEPPEQAFKVKTARSKIEIKRLALIINIIY